MSIPIVGAVLARATRSAILLLGILALPACSGQPVDQSPPPPPPGPPPPLPPPPPPAEVTLAVSVDTLQRFQVITGWEATASVGQGDFPATPWADQVIDLASNDLGINRLRLEVRSGSEHPADNFAAWRAGTLSDTEWRALRYTVVNDNGDPSVANPAGFHFTELDLAMDRVVVPMRARLAARGERLALNLNYVSFVGGGVVHTTASEYAEFMLATFEHLQAKYGFVPDAIEAILEPDNNTAWNAALLGQAIVAAVARLGTAGFRPEVIAPSTMNMGAARTWFDAMIQVPGLLPVLTELSYHRYQGVSDANLAQIASRAAQYDLRTAMLEHIGSGVEDLHKDLTVGNVSAWQQFTLAYPSTNDNGGKYYLIQEGSPVIGSRTRELRQYFRHVRAGARRVAASSDKAAVRTAAFTNVGGGPVVVVHLGGPEVIEITGLRPGRYELTSSHPSHPVLGASTVGGDGELRFSAPAAGVLTVTWKP